MLSLAAGEVNQEGKPHHPGEHLIFSKYWKSAVVIVIYIVERGFAKFALSSALPES